MQNNLSGLFIHWPSGKAQRVGLYLVTFLMILIPRITLLGHVATVDELAWMHRSHHYIDAVKSGRFNETLFTHPGITLMWVAGAVGELAELARPVQYDVRKYQPNMRYRLKVEQAAVATVISILGWLACLWFAQALKSGYLLITSSLLIGADPFYVGLSRIVHLDGLMATFALAACAALARFMVRDHSSANSTNLRSYTWLAVSGALAGLSIMTKTTGAILLPWALIILAVSRWINTTATLSKAWFALPRSISWSIRMWALWLVVLSAVVTAIWPAMWVDPVKSLPIFKASADWAQQQPGKEAVLSNLDTISHYFIRFPIFIAPWIPWIFVVCAVVFVCVALLNKKWKAQYEVMGVTTEPLDTRNWLSIVLSLTVLAMLYPVGIGLFEQQAGRYIITSFIAVDVLAAIACSWVIFKLVTYRPVLRSSITILFSCLCIVCWITIATWLPYTTAYRHPSWGNLPVNGKPLPRGWGEGLEKVAERLNQLEHSDQLTVAIRHHWILRIFFKGISKDFKSPLEGTADFAVLERAFVEQHPDSEFIRTFRASHTLFDTIYLPQDKNEPISWIYYVNE